MKPSPLQQRISAALAEGGMVEILTDLALSLNGDPDSKEPVPLSLSLIDRIFEVIAAATPAEIVEEGGYLLGASHLWSDTQGSRATEHMVRRITAADQIVRSRLERDLERAREAAKEGSDLRSRLTGHSWSSKAVMHEVLAVMERQD